MWRQVLRKLLRRQVAVGELTNETVASHRIASPVPHRADTSVTIAWVFQSERLDMAALFGMGLIVSGVVVINLFSSASSH
jgi:hypothetical protein